MHYVDTQKMLEQDPLSVPAHHSLGLTHHAAAHFADAEAAYFEWLERAYAQRDVGLAETKPSPPLRSLHGDPRWYAFLRRWGSSSRRLLPRQHYPLHLQVIVFHLEWLAKPPTQCLAPEKPPS